MNQTIKEIGKKVVGLFPDKLWLSCYFRKRTGYKMDWKNPKTFNQKLQWLKVYDRKPLYTTLVDKYQVKKYVAEKIGEEYIIPTLGVWDGFDEIDFDSLPDQFVLKCTHDSGGLAIVRDKAKFDKEKARKQFKLALSRNPYSVTREWPYKNVKPRIIAEQYMEDNTTHELRDYKFFCFDGMVGFFKIDFDRYVAHRANYYDRGGNLLPFGEIVCPPCFEQKLDMPIRLSKMISMAEKLATDSIFLRVDFYEVNGQVYFGEITFFPASGMGPFVPDEWDRKLGEWIQLPKKK